MKNIQFIIALCLSTMATLHAQTGKLNLSAGIGFEPTTLMDNAEINAIPLTLKVGYQFTQMLSLNVFGGHTSTTSQPSVINDGLTLRTNMEQTFVGLRGELKKGLGQRFEVYGGASFGYVKQKRTELTGAGTVFSRNPEGPTKLDPNAPKCRMLYSGFVGTNFFVTKHVGLFAEAGSGITLFNGGITARF
jgi:hypothetical protein